MTTREQIRQAALQHVDWCEIHNEPGGIVILYWSLKPISNIDLYLILQKEKAACVRLSVWETKAPWRVRLRVILRDWWARFRGLRRRYEPSTLP